MKKFFACAVFAAISLLVSCGDDDTTSASLSQVVIFDQTTGQLVSNVEFDTTTGSQNFSIGLTNPNIEVDKLSVDMADLGDVESNFEVTGVDVVEASRAAEASLSFSVTAVTPNLTAAVHTETVVITHDGEVIHSFKVSQAAVAAAEVLDITYGDNKTSTKNENGAYSYTFDSNETEGVKFTVATDDSPSKPEVATKGGDAADEAVVTTSIKEIKSNGTYFTVDEDLDNDAFTVTPIEEVNGTETITIVLNDVYETEVKFTVSQATAKSPTLTITGAGKDDADNGIDYAIAYDNKVESLTTIVVGGKNLDNAKISIAVNDESNNFTVSSMNSYNEISIRPKGNTTSRAAATATVTITATVAGAMADAVTVISISQAGVGDNMTVETVTKAATIAFDTKVSTAFEFKAGNTIPSDESVYYTISYGTSDYFTDITDETEVKLASDGTFSITPIVDQTNAVATKTEITATIILYADAEGETVLSTINDAKITLEAKPTITEVTATGNKDIANGDKTGVELTVTGTNLSDATITAVSSNEAAFTVAVAADGTVTVTPTGNAGSRDTATATITVRATIGEYYAEKEIEFTQLGATALEIATAADAETEVAYGSKEIDGIEFTASNNIAGDVVYYTITYTGTGAGAYFTAVSTPAELAVGTDGKIVVTPIVKSENEETAGAEFTATIKFYTDATGTTQIGADQKQTIVFAEYVAPDPVVTGAAVTTGAATSANGNTDAVTVTVTGTDFVDVDSIKVTSDAENFVVSDVTFVSATSITFVVTPQGNTTSHKTATATILVNGENGIDFSQEGVADMTITADKDSVSVAQDATTADFVFDVANYIASEDTVKYTVSFDDNTYYSNITNKADASVVDKKTITIALTNKKYEVTSNGAATATFVFYNGDEDLTGTSIEVGIVLTAAAAAEQGEFN